MNEWYSKGLIDPDFAVQDSKTFDAKVASGEAGAYFNSVGGGMSKYCRGAVMGPMIQDARYFEQYQQTPEQKETAQIWNLSDTDWQMPPVTLTTEEANRISSKQTEIITYVNETSLKFIMGAEPMSNIQKFRDTIKDMGIDDVLTVQQAAYERFKER